MRGLTLLTLVALAHPAWADRAAAQQLADEAERTHEDADFVRCGEAFLDLYNQDPTASAVDEALFDAARCFERGKSVSASLQTYAILIKSFPSSKLAAKALVFSGRLYEQIAFYDRAAERFEDYASRFAGEKDAVDVLGDAIRLRAALGDTAKQSRDTQRLIRTYGAKQPKRAAAARLALLPALDGAPAIALLRSYLEDYATLDPDQTIAVHLELADRLRAKSCPVPEIDQLCVKAVAARAPNCSHGASLVVVKRTVEYKAAIAEYRAVIAAPVLGATSRHAVAMAQIAVADADLEAMIAAVLPHDLDFSASQGKAYLASQVRFGTWLDAENRLGEKLLHAYSAVIDQHDPVSSVAATERIGEATMTLWRALMLGEIPKDVKTRPQRAAYCTAMESVANAIAARAVEVFTSCVVKAGELDVAHEWGSACWREGARLDPVTFELPTELRGAISGYAPLIATESALTPPP